MTPQLVEFVESFFRQPKDFVDDARVAKKLMISEDVPGLITESKIMEQLVDKLKILIPELLEATR